MTAPRLTVHVNSVEPTPTLTHDDVEAAVRAAAAAETVTRGEISITFFDRAAMAALNETHLGRPGPTDVIAFNLSEPDDPLGDVYVCPAVAAESADEYGVELREELLRLVIHGTLHVFGHDHPDGLDREASEMYRLQEEILLGLL
jgi:probable rRNA maturation factor